MWKALLDLHTPLLREAFLSRVIAIGFPIRSNLGKILSTKCLVIAFGFPIRKMIVYWGLLLGAVFMEAPYLEGARTVDNALSYMSREAKRILLM